MERKNANKSIAIITKKYNIKNRKGEAVAYTIISQNNTTTTLADENGNVITVPARVTLATSTDYTITKVNNNSVDLEDGDGKIIRGVPACVVLAGEGGGGATYTAGNGISIDSNNEISVADPVLVNKTAKSHSLAISDYPSFNDSHMGTSAIYIGRTARGFDNAYVGNNAVGIGVNSLGSASNYGTAINAGSGEYSVFVGSGTQGDTGNHNTGIGYKTGSDFNKKYGVAIGVGAWIGANNTIQICAKGNDTVVSNHDANTFKVANANGNFELMNANGNLPADRLASTTGLADGNYRLRLVMASGVPTLEWVAE